jgi:hypothetical protein
MRSFPEDTLSNQAMTELTRLNQALAARPEPKPTSSKVATFSLFVAILSTSFAIFQWWNSGRGERIRAAIEISNRYISEAIEPYILIRLLEMGQIQGPANISKIKSQFSRLEYVAYLTNRGLLNADYLSKGLVCDIVDMVNKKNEVPILRETPTDEAEKFADAHEDVCQTGDAAEPSEDEPKSPNQPKPKEEKNPPSKKGAAKNSDAAHAAFGGRFAASAS